MGAFGSKKETKQVLRENKRMITKAIRELDRERRKMETEEKKCITDIRKHAKLQQMDVVTIKAKDLVKTRNYIKKFIIMRSRLQAINLKLTTAKSTEAMIGSMRGVTRAMVSMNRSMNLPELQRLMQRFQMADEMLDDKMEMMGDSIDDAVAEEGDEAEQDEIVGRILDEIGIDFNGAVPSAHDGSLAKPTATTAQPAKTAVPMGAGGDIDDLEARLNNLKKP